MDKAGRGLLAALAAVALQAAPAGASGPDPATAAKIYARCAACHTPTGAGIPGAFPPLTTQFRALAAHPQGRIYLQLTVIRGVSGPISVDGKIYRGLMPAQVLDDMAIADVLNFIGTTIAKGGPDFSPFTAEEVGVTRSNGKAMTASTVAKLRPGGAK